MSTEGSNPSLSATPIRFASISCRVARRGRLVAYGAALEMRFGATRRGFESPPLRHSRDFSRCGAPPIPPRGSNDEAAHRIGPIRARACRGFPGYGTWRHPTAWITSERGPPSSLDPCRGTPRRDRVAPFPHVIQRPLRQPILVAPYRQWYAQATESPESTRNPAAIVRCITRGNIPVAAARETHPD